MLKGRKADEKQSRDEDDQNNIRTEKGLLQFRVANTEAVKLSVDLIKMRSHTLIITDMLGIFTSSYLLAILWKC